MWMHRGIKIAVKRYIKIDWYFDMIQVFFEYGITFEIDTVFCFDFGKCLGNTIKLLMTVNENVNDC